MRSLPQLRLQQAATALSIRQVQLAQSVLLLLAGFAGTLRACRNL